MSQASKVLSIAAADHIWSLYGFTAPRDLVLEELAMALGIIVMDGPLESATARLLRSGDAGLIRVSQSIREPGRRRFAIAHEIGHWRLHQRVSHLLACTDDDLLANYKSSAYEVEASIFAGALLMPQQLFDIHSAGRTPTTSVIKELATYFGTGLTATALRYIETSKDYCLFVVSEQNRIRWWRASDALKERGFWIEPRSALPAHSAGASCFRSEAVSTQPREIDLRDWFGDLPGVDGDVVLEQAIPLTEYGQVLSLIWLP